MTTATAVKTEYSWSGGRSFAVSAATVGAIIENIQATKGVCRPQSLVDAARPATSPIHSMFEWDNSKAAESYRTEQARGVLQALKVVIRKPQLRPVARPAFVSVKPATTKSRGYVTVRSAMSAQDTRDQLLAEALRHLESIRRRFEMLDELAEVWKAIDAAAAAKKVKRQAR